MSRVVHFEMVGDDPERMAKFYSKTFGWKVQKWEGSTDYWLVITGEDGTTGINGGFGRRAKPNEGTTNTIDVDDAKAVVAAVEKNGGKVVNPLHPIPGVGWQAYCEDTEGNVFGIHQNDPNAK
jgi:predicted enzyme related to lactoylglutathione lyase